MPAYKKTSKYSVEQTQSISVAVFGVLAEAQRALTIPEIQGRDLSLVNQTSQKLSRVLNELVEAGFISKGFDKERGRVNYKIVGEVNGY